MDLELGLKITKTRDDIASISEYRLSKAGPVFQSRETNTMFILTAGLKGYKKNNININISEDGSKISISGEKPIQNILMMGWLMHRKEVEVSGFYKVFKIPDGVKLDGIKAKYDDEEWILNIFMPKLVKGICGAKIEEIKEEEPEKSEADQIGETSQKGSKESEVEAVEDSECYMKEKEEVSDNREIIKEKVQKEVEEPKLGTEGGIGESVGEEGGMEGLEVMRRSELEPNVGRGTSQKVGDTSQKELEESKLRIEDGGVNRMREEVGKTEYEAVKTTELEKNVGKDMSQNIGDTCQDKEFEVQTMEDNGGFVEEGEVATEKRTNDDNGNKIGEVIQKEIEESKSAIEDKDGKGVKGRIGKAGYRGIKTSEIEQNVGAHDTQNIGDTSQGVSKESVIEQMWEDKSSVEAKVSTKEETLGESRQKQFGEPKAETKDRLEESEKEGSMELMETLKAPKLDQNLDDHIPINISKEEFKKFRIQQKEETESIEDNMDAGESERMPVETNKDSQKHISGDSIQEDIKVSKIETEDEDEEYVGEKGGKEECDSMITIRDEFPPQLPKAALVEESKGLSDSKLKEIEDVKEAMIKRKPIEIEYFVNKGEGEQPRRMHKEDKKDLTKETAKESEDVKQAMVKREGKEIEYYVDKGKGEERKRMDMKGKKDLTTETMQESDDVKEAMIKRKGIGIENYLDQGEEKDITSEKMQDTEDVSEVVFRRKDKEIESFADKGEGEESRRMHMKAKKDIQKETVQEIEEVKDETVKSKGKSIQDFLEKGEGGELINKQMEAKKETRKKKRQESEDVKDGEEPKTMHMERKKNLAKETMKESKDAKEAMVKREGKEIEYYGGENEQNKRIHTDAKKDLTKEKMQESKDVKEAMIKKNGKEIDYFLNKGEGQEPKRIHMEEKKDPRTERRKATEDVKRKDKEINNFAKKGEDKEPRRMLMEAKKDFTKDTMQGSEHVKEAMAKNKGKETEYFLDKSEREDPKRMHKEAKKDLTTMKKESEDIKEAKVKRKGKEIDNFLVEGEGKEPNVMHQEAEDIKKETIQDIEDIKEVKVKRRNEKIENFEDKGDGEEPMLMKTNKELTEETMEESEDAKEATAKRKGNEIEHFVDKNEGKELKRVHTEEKKDSGKKTMQESKHVKEAIVKREGKEVPKRMHTNAKKDFKNERVHENEDVKEEMFKRGGKEIDYFVGEGEDEEPKRMQIKAKKDSATDTMQESEDVKEVVVKREKKEIENFADNAEGKEPKKKRMGEETVKRKFEVPTEEFHKLVGGKDGSRGLKLDEEKEMIKEPMAESESLMETVKAKKSKKNEEAGRVTEENTATEILKKETEVSNNMVKVIFEVLGTFQAKLPKQMMEAISQNKDKSEYVVVKLKGEGSIKMHVQPKEAFDGDETEDRIERDLKATSEREKDRKAVEEGMLKGEYRAEVVPEKEREKPKVAKSEEAKEASRLPLEREMEKTVQTVEDKKPKMKKIGPEFEKASDFKQVAEKMHQISKREHQRESEGVEKSKEEMSPMPRAIRQEPHELSLPIKDDKIPKIEEVRQKKEGEKAIHSLEATTSKEEELALATHSKTKGEIDESQEVQFPSPSIQTSIEEPYALDKHGTKEDDSKAESLVQIQERKEAIHSIEGSAESGVVVDEVAEPSKISSSSSTQPFEVKGKDNTYASRDKESQDSDKYSEIDGQESTKGETDQEVEQGETPQPESLAYQQYINKEKEGHGTHEIEEEKAYEQKDKVGQQDSQLLEEQNEYEEEVTGGKNNQKMSKKLLVSMMIAGSALIASGIFLFIRHRRAKNSTK